MESFYFSSFKHRLRNQNAKCRSPLRRMKMGAQEEPRDKTIQKNDHMRTIWSSTPRPTAKNQSAGAGVPMGRRRRACLAAKRGSINIQS